MYKPLPDRTNMKRSQFYFPATAWTRFLALVLIVSIVSLAVGGCDSEPTVASSPPQPPPRIYGPGYALQLSLIPESFAAGDTVVASISVRTLVEGTGFVELSGYASGNNVAELIHPVRQLIGGVSFPVHFAMDDTLTMEMTMRTFDDFWGGRFTAFCRLDSVLIDQEMVSVDSREFVYVYGLSALVGLNVSVSVY